ncbi:hypothetical protein KJ903_01835 [Patescibacteria group bacterium]|nr:hypothetical protein [Patescibacteria group bacterium]
MPISITKDILNKVKDLPYFSINDLVSLEDDKKYLRIYLSRLAKRKKIVPLRQGVYVSRDYIEETEKKGEYSDYLEFVGHILYPPAYLSLEYVLAQNNILTEFTQHFTLVTKNKTARFANELGLFVYHQIKESLFCQFEMTKKGNLLIYRAGKVKALFDFLYFRKNNLINKEAVDELRLNLENFNKQDILELKGYVKLEGSRKMAEIYTYLFAGK